MCRGKVHCAARLWLRDSIRAIARHSFGHVGAVRVLGTGLPSAPSRNSVSGVTHSCAPITRDGVSLSIRAPLINTEDRLTLRFALEQPGRPRYSNSEARLMSAGSVLGAIGIPTAPAPAPCLTNDAEGRQTSQAPTNRHVRATQNGGPLNRTGEERRVGATAAKDVYDLRQGAQVGGVPARDRIEAGRIGGGGRESGRGDEPERGFM